MTINLSALSDATLTADTLANLILVSPIDPSGYRPQNDGGVVTQISFLFDFETRNEVELSSDITDHYIEDNTSVNDQIALKPEIVSVNGYIGELNDIAPFGLQTLKEASERLYIVSGLTPELSITALTVYNNAKQFYEVLAKTIIAGGSAWKSINNVVNEITGLGLRDDTPDDNQTQQQIIFQQFYMYWRNKVLFTVQTPWAIFKDMAIQSLSAIQDDETRMITDFQITFKLLRFATVEFEESKAKQGRNKHQSSSLVDLGEQKGQESSSSFLSTAVS